MRGWSLESVLASPVVRLVRNRDGRDVRLSADLLEDLVDLAHARRRKHVGHAAVVLPGERGLLRFWHADRLLRQARWLAAAVAGGDEQEIEARRRELEGELSSLDGALARHGGVGLERELGTQPPPSPRD